jgi:hypothetical protein
VKERFMSRQEVISAVGGPGYAAVARQLAEEAQIDRDVGLAAAPVAEEPEPDPDPEEADEDDEQLEDEEQVEDDELEDEEPAAAEVAAMER